MSQETIAGLVKDLAGRLSGIANEFSNRADKIMVGDQKGTSESSKSPRELAKILLAQRVARFDYFPAELFHEPAWDMLLALFVAQAEKKVMNVKTMVASAHAPVTTSQRWIDHLHKLGLIDRVIDPVDRRRMEVSLSDSGERAVLAYLQQLGAA